MTALPVSRRRPAAVLWAAAAAAATAAGVLALPASAAPSVVRPGVEHVLPAGYNPEGREEPRAAMLPSGANNENDNVADYLRYTRQAARLGVTKAGTRWVDRGPFGVDMPPGYSQSVERFARVSGMGAAVAVDSNDPKGNTVYIGNMGGLWKSTDAGAHWRNLTDGKIPRSAVGAIGLDPKHPKDIYIGTGISLLTLSGDANGTGIYVSHDGGATFHRPKQATTGYGSNVVRVTPNAVFVGTNRGLFRSTDRGKSFQRVPLPTGKGGSPAKGVVANWVSDVVAKPGKPSEVTAAVGFGLGKLKLPDGSVASPGNGLYRSTVGGKPGSFTRMASTSQLRHPASSNDPVGRIQLAYGQAPGDTNTLWAAVSDAGLAAGLQPAGLDIISSTTGQGLNKTNTVFNGLYRSGDDGANWDLKANPQILQTSPNSLLAVFGVLGYGVGVQAFYNLWVATDPKVADQIYFGLEEVFQGAPAPPAGLADGPYAFQTIQRYADLCGFLLYFQNITNGASCPDQTPIVGGMSTHPDQHTAVVVPVPGGSRIYTGNDGGFFRQDSHVLGTDGINPTQVGFDNRQWTAANTLSTLQAWHVAMKPDGEIIAALQDNGSILVRKSGKGISVCGGDGYWVMPTPDPDVWYCSTPGAVLYYTKDHGKNITAIPPGTPTNGGLNGAAFTSPIVMDPTNPKHIVAAATEVEETSKGTDTKVTYDSAATGTIVSTDWQSVYDAGDSPRTNPTTGATYPWSATALGVRGPVIYDAACAACRGAFTPPALLRTKIFTNSKAGCTAKTGSTACWHRAKSKGLPKAWVSSVVVDPRDTKTIYVGIGQQNPFEYPKKATGSAKVLVSHDRGDHFTDLTKNLPRTEVRGMVYRDGRLIVASDVGIFTRPVKGGSWTRLGAGLPTGVVARDIYLDPTGRYLVASMYGRGVWVLTFGAKAPSSNGPGENGAPSSGGSGGSSDGGNGTGMAPTGLPSGLGALAVLFAAAAIIVGRRRTLEA